MPDQPRDQKQVDQLVAELANVGAAEPGEFTLDRETAREKLAQFQLPDLHLYLVELVQGLLHLGARQLAVRYDLDDVWVGSDGAPLTDADFEHLYGALFTSGDDSRLQARRDLAVGLQAAAELGPRTVRIFSRDAEGVVSLQSRPGRPDTYGPDDQGEATLAEHLLPDDTPPVTLIHVRAHLGADAPQRAVKGLANEPEEIAALRRRGQYLEGRLTVNGDPLETRPLDHLLLRPVPLKGPGFAGVFGAHAEGTGPSRLVLLQQGMVRAVHDLPGPEGYRARVEAPRLRRDLSQFDFVQNGDYKAVIKKLKSASRRAIPLLVEHLAEQEAGQPEIDAGPLRRVLRLTLCSEVAATGARARWKKVPGPVLKALLAAPVWPCFSTSPQREDRALPKTPDRHVAALWMQQQAKNGQNVYSASRPPLDAYQSSDLIFAPEKSERQCLQTLLGSAYHDSTPTAAPTEKRRWLFGILYALPLVAVAVAFAVALINDMSKYLEIQSLEQRCSGGSGSACYLKAALKGKLDPHWYNMGCQKGHRASCRMLLRLKGPDMQEASLQKACTMGLGKSCLWLGKQLSNTNSSSLDRPGAAKAYRRACATGVAEGCYRAGDALRTGGKDLPSDDAAAYRLLERGCQLGSALACEGVGILLLAQPDKSGTWAKGLARFRLGCEDHEAYACFRLGYALLKGEGIRKDTVAATALLEKACEHELAKACSTLAYHHTVGRLLGVNLARARRFGRRACRLGSKIGCANVGNVLKEGTAAEKRESVELYRQACEMGDGNGCHGLGLAYQLGIGAPVDKKCAAALHKKACKLGAKKACE